MTIPTDINASSVEEVRDHLIAAVNKAFDELLGRSTSPATESDVHYVIPTPADGLDPRNKNGLNLTARGVEILYRVFDDDGGYNRAAKMVGISQNAAKNRKQLWVKDGGKKRKKMPLDIDKRL